MTQLGKNLDYYKKLPYTLLVSFDTDVKGEIYWIAEYKELRGCKADGSNEAEAVANLFELFDEYIEIMLEAATPIPEPEKVEVAVETMKITIKKEQSKLHREITQEAEDTFGKASFEEENVNATELISEAA